MKRGNFRDQKWYPNTIAICSGVVLYVTLTNLPAIMQGLKSIRIYFSTVLWGCVIAYTINPLASFFERTICSPIKNLKTKWEISVGAAMVSVIAVFTLLMVTIVPQLINSVQLFASNIDNYASSLEALISRADFLKEFTSLTNIIDSWADYVGNFLTKNIDKILSTSADIGKAAVNFFIAVILSVYLLMEKRHVKEYSYRFMHALMAEKQTEKVLTFLRRCDNILVRYISCSLLESVIIFAANAMFMNICGMEYVGLISVIVAVFNLIPTFGPMIGGLIGAFILVLIRPYHALLFLIFTIILQTIDGYVIKPKLFGNSLGVSGLLILISVIVCGNMFGITGIVLAIPIAAIVDFSYTDLLLPALEKHKQKERTDLIS